jgi:excisionase family DNA binding protein
MSTISSGNGGDADAVAAARLYLRPDELVAVLGISRRTLSKWQAKRLVPFRRIGRAVLFSVKEVQATIDRFSVAAIGEPKPSARHTTRKRRMTKTTG